MKDDGVIKFSCEWQDAPVEFFSEFPRFKSWRDRLYKMNLIGEAEGIGFGNISVREKEREFIITATQTGKYAELALEHCTRVMDYDFDRHHVFCRGADKASSESLTHAMFYELDSGIGAVIHVHSLMMWRRLAGKVPTTGPEVPYGTREMSHEVKRLYDGGSLARDRILVMAGHEEGIITFGTDLDAAGEQLLKYAAECGAAGA